MKRIHLLLRRLGRESSDLVGNSSLADWLERERAPHSEAGSPISLGGLGVIGPLATTGDARQTMTDQLRTLHDLPESGRRGADLGDVATSRIPNTSDACDDIETSAGDLLPSV